MKKAKLEELSAIELYIELRQQLRVLQALGYDVSDLYCTLHLLLQKVRKFTVLTEKQALFFSEILK